nr:peptidase MA family metallohydrolase [Anaerolinea sp.]
MGGNRLRRALLLTLLVCIALLAGRPAPALAQAGVEFKDVAAFVEFGKTVTFQAVIASETPVQEAVLTIHPQGLEAVIQPVTLNAQNEIVYQLDLVNNPLRPFSRVKYTFRLLLANGNSVDSPNYTFDYTDTRFTWQSLSNDQFEIFWYDREIALGQRALNSAQLGLQSIQNILPVSLEQSVRVYIYNTANDFKGALPGSQPWIAGQSAPDLGVILLTIPVGPEEQLQLERQLPHELMHVVLYQLAGEKTANLPAWLVEGLASTAEIYPNPDYASTLNTSAAEG